MSIQATPVTRLVYTLFGRRKAAYIDGTPSDATSDGCHSPLTGVGLATNGTRAAGVARWTGPVTTGTVVGTDEVGFGMAPATGFPPLGGACHVYQVFSAQVTIRRPPPWSRTHSVRPIFSPADGPERRRSVAAEAHRHPHRREEEYE